MGVIPHWIFKIQKNTFALYHPLHKHTADHNKYLQQLPIICTSTLYYVIWNTIDYSRWGKGAHAISFDDTCSSPLNWSPKPVAFRSSLHPIKCTLLEIPIHNKKHWTLKMTSMLWIQFKDRSALEYKMQLFVMFTHIQYIWFFNQFSFFHTLAVF